jgi:hypothetical protein
MHLLNGACREVPMPPIAAIDDPTAPKELPEPDSLERLVREDYERCHPGETFDDMKQRAPYSRIDKGLYRAWMALAATRAALLADAAR